MADVKWIKITTNMFDDEKIKLIQSLPEGDSILVIWVRLIILAGKTNNNGYVYINENLPYTDEMLSTIFNKPLATVRLALKTFNDLKMIDIDETGIYLINFEKYQNVEGLEKIREQNRLRKQKQREKEKQLLLNCHVTSRDSHATDIDKEKEIEIEIDKDINKKNKKEKKSTEIDDLINSNFTDDELKNTVYEFIKMRKAIKKPLTTRGLELMIKKLYKITTDINEQIEILNNSIMNNWQGIFPLKQNDNNKNKGGFDDFKEIWEEAKLQDEQTGNHSNNNTFGW